MAVITHNAESAEPEQSINDSIEYGIIQKVVGNNIPILEHSAWFQDTQLAQKGHTIWTSYPIDPNDILMHDK